MPYTTAEGRQQLLEALAGAGEEIGLALAALGEAYEQVDEATGDRLEDGLFRPVQLAYGRVQRAFEQFATRYGLPGHEFGRSGPVGRPHDPRGAIERSLRALEAAEAELAALQDSMLPVEVGDVELRTALAEVRTLIGPLPARGRELLRTLGR